MVEEIKLTEEDLTRLNEANETIGELEKFATLAKRAGHDTTSVEQFIREKRSQIRNHKEAFFPGR